MNMNILININTSEYENPNNQTPDNETLRIKKKNPQ